MADYRTRVTTEVIINGQQAQAEVDKLGKKVLPHFPIVGQKVGFFTTDIVILNSFH